MFIRLLDETLDARRLSWTALGIQFAGAMLWDVAAAPQRHATAPSKKLPLGLSIRF